MKGRIYPCGLLWHTEACMHPYTRRLGLTLVVWWCCLLPSYCLLQSYICPCSLLLIPSKGRGIITQALFHTSIPCMAVWLTPIIFLGMCRAKTRNLATIWERMTRPKSYVNYRRRAQERRSANLLWMRIRRRRWCLSTIRSRWAACAWARERERERESTYLRRYVLARAYCAWGYVEGMMHCYHESSWLVWIILYLFVWYMSAWCGPVQESLSKKIFVDWHPRTNIWTHVCSAGGNEEVAGRRGRQPFELAVGKSKLAEIDSAGNWFR